MDIVFIKNEKQLKIYKLLFHPSYFASIIQYVAQVNSDSLLFETEDNYQKQTYRNRCYIYGANGKQMLNVPIIHLKHEERNKTKDIQVNYSEPWQKLHIKTLDSAYSSSPFYEFYKDDIISVIQKRFKYLLDLNFETIFALNECLQLKCSVHKTDKYDSNLIVDLDFRYLVDAKNKNEYAFQKYTQVFDQKHGYIANLSCLDLLFNEGPNALEYLEAHKKLLIQ